MRNIGGNKGVVCDILRTGEGYAYVSLLLSPADSDTELSDRLNPFSSKDVLFPFDEVSDVDVLAFFTSDDVRHDWSEHAYTKDEFMAALGEDSRLAAMVKQTPALFKDRMHIVARRSFSALDGSYAEFMAQSSEIIESGVERSFSFVIKLGDKTSLTHPMVSCILDMIGGRHVHER